MDTSCGNIQIQGGAGSRYVFCEGEVICIYNNTPAAAGWDYTLYCWRDGTSSLVPGNGGATHQYSLPPDTCIRNNRNITRQIYMIGYKRCDQKYSVNYIIIPVEIRAKPKASVKLDGTACVNADTRFINDACPNVPSAEVTYLWEYGDGMTSTASAASVTHRYTQEGTYTVKLTVTNSCNSAVYTQTIFVQGQPVAKARHFPCGFIH